MISDYKIGKDVHLKINGRFYNQFNEHDDAYSFPADSLVHYRDDKVTALNILD